MRIFIILLLSCSLISANAVSATDQPNIHASKITFNDPSIGRKIAISFHHAILESKPEQGYIIANLQESEIADLTSRGIEVKIATEWQKKYNSFQTNLQKQIAFNQSNNVVAAGIPGFACYPTVEETFQQANDLATNNPQIAEWIDIGDSWKKTNGQGGYDLMVLKITNKNVAGDKPILFVHSSMHAREYTPAALNLDFAKQLINEYTTNADIQWIIDYHEVHLMFQMNPDGRKIAETGVYQRKNTNQNHCPANTIGVDLNRNFAFFWNTTANGSSGADCDGDFRGLSAESEPETAAVSNYLRSIYPDVRGPNSDDSAPEDTPGLHLDLHSYSQLVLWPYGHTDTISPNNAGFVTLGNKFAWFNNYAPMQSVGLYPTDGTSDDVSYGELGIAAFTFELGSDFFESCSNYTNRIKPDNLPALIYAAKVAAAPYLLGFGAEITQIEMNDSTSTISVSQGTPINLEITASATRTRQSTLGKSVSKIEYSIDTPIWQEAATPIELTGNDGDLSSGVEVLTAQLTTQDLSLGRHTIYFRAFSATGKIGVTSAAFFDIAENDSPSPSFTFSCADLTCSFDGSASFDSDGTIAEYAWDFQDGNSAEGATTTHTFSQAGDKQVSLMLTDNLGLSATTSEQFSVTAPPVFLPVPIETSSSGGGVFGWISNLLLLLVFARNKKLHIRPKI